MKASEETKKKAKDLGITSWHVKSEERLNEEIANMDKPITQPVVPEPVKAPVQPKVVEEDLTLPTDITPKLMAWSIKCIGKKSPYWKYKDLL